MDITKLSVEQARQLAIAFLLDDLEVPADEQDWFSTLSARQVGTTWYVVEIGVEGLPDKWVVQVYDTGECDPSYTFTSPIEATEVDTGLEDLPAAIARILALVRSNKGMV
jgi:hypothetical protein